MSNQEGNEKTEVGLIDAFDHATKLRASIGYLANTAQSNDLACLLWTIEESAGMLEKLLEVLVEGEASAQAMKEA